MQVHDTPLLLNQSGDSVAVQVGAGGSGVYYGPYRDHDILKAQGTVAAPGSTFSVSTPTWVLSQGDRDGAPADVQVVTDTLPSSPSSAASGGAKVFNVTDAAYGADPTGVADSSAAIQAAHDAAVAAGGGIVYLPAGTFRIASINGTSNAAIIVPANLAGHVTFRGAGRGATIIRTVAPAYTFIASPTTVNVGDTLQNVTVEDITFDANNLTATGPGVVCHFWGVQMNLARITIRRCDVINGGVPSAAGVGRRAITMGVTRNENFGATQNTATDITVEDCRLQGTNTGVFIAAFCTATKLGNQFPGASVARANVVFDRINVRRVSWDSGETPTQFKTSAGIQLVGDGLGLQVNVEDCWAKGSGDVNYELDGCTNLTVSGCYGENAWNENFFLANNHGGLPPSVARGAVARFVHCKSVHSQPGIGSAGFAAFAKNVSSFGTVIFHGCKVERANATYNSNALIPTPSFVTQGPADAIIVRDCAVAFRNLAQVATANTQTFMLVAAQINAVGRACSVIVDGLDAQWEGTVDQSTFTGLTATCTALQLRDGARASLSIRNVKPRVNVKALNGAFVFARGVEFNSFGNLQDPFNADTTGDFLADTGALSDLAVSGGLLTSVANHATEKQLRHLQFSAASAINEQIQRTMDGAYFVGGTPGAVTTAFKLGVRMRVSDDGLTFVEGYVDDDGTNSRLRIDKVIAGVRTNLASTNLAGRIANGTGLGVRFKAQGDVLTVEQFAGTAAPSFATAGAAVTTYTLTAAESLQVGDLGPLGWLGPTWTPQDAAATIDIVRYDRMSVYSGSIERLDPPPPVFAPRQTNAVIFNLSDTQLRFPSKLRVAHSDLRPWKVGTSTAVEANYNASPSTGLKSSVVLERIDWMTPPVPAAVTVGASPFTYTNQDGYTEDIALYGGTASLVEVTRDGTNFATVQTATPASIRLGPGEQVRVTYTAAPTMRKVPVL